LAAQAPEERDFRRLVLEDPAVQSLHLALLQESPPPPETPQERLTALVEAAKRRDTARFSRSDWIALLSDPNSITAASSA
jgi:hypothetical protein